MCADTASKAIRRQLALERIARVSERFDKAAGNKLGPLTLPTYDRDPEFLQAWQLDIIATYLEKLATAQGVAGPTYDEMTNAELDAELEKRGLPIAHGSVKADRVAALKANDAEAQQREARLTALRAMTLDELRADAARQNVDLTGLTRKTEVLQRLEAQETQSSREEGATVSNPINYDGMTIEQIRTEAQNRQIVGWDTLGRDELVDALQASDGMTEEEQEAQDMTRTRGGQSQERAGDTPGFQKNQPGVKGEGRASEGNAGGQSGTRSGGQQGDAASGGKRQGGNREG